MRYVVEYNLPGCLPDDTNEPAIFDSLDEAIDAAKMDVWYAQNGFDELTCDEHMTRDDLFAYPFRDGDSVVVGVFSDGYVLCINAFED